MNRSNQSGESLPSPSAFATTQWTRVLQARGDSQAARAALSDLCAAYYTPVLAFIQRGGFDEDAARDLTHEFFARLLARHGIEHVDQQRGRFRSFLLGAVKHFLSDIRAQAHRQKRGSGQTLESIDAAMDASSDTSPGLQLADPNAPTPDRDFDRKWAMTLLARALTALAQEYEAAGKSDQFDALKPWLTGDAETISQAEAASRLGMNEGAVKVAIHRLRRRFRESIKNEIGQTVIDSVQVESELHYLFEALL